MQVDFPQIDQIIHASLDRGSYSQREYVLLMNRCNNFINITFESFLDRITREYDPEPLIDILSMVNMILKEEAESCPDNKIYYDDFVKNASLVSQSLKKIINSPGRQLIKIEKNVPANKITQFDSKTMTWLSRRPGVTIEEKISPRNTIPTKVTYFSADTVENRHTMYLFDILYDYLYEKIYPAEGELPCENCSYKDKKCYELYEKLKTVLFLKHKVRTTNLKDVPKQKQLRQNNKLMSDKEYKLIWDAVRDIDYYEQNCKNVWNNLEDRYRFIIFLIVCAGFSNLEGFYVFDELACIVDHDGRIGLVSDSGVNIARFYDSDKENELVVRLVDTELYIRINRFYSDNGISYKKEEIYSRTIDLSGLFNEIDVIKDKERKLSILEEEISDLNVQIRETEYEILDFESKKDIMQLLAGLIAHKMETMKSDEVEMALEENY